MFTQVLQIQAQVMLWFLQTSTGDQVINVYTEVKATEYLIHEELESLGCVLKAEWHTKV